MEQHKVLSFDVPLVCYLQLYNNLQLYVQQRTTEPLPIMLWASMLFKQTHFRSQ